MSPEPPIILPTYESLCDGLGAVWFGQSWVVVERWLEATADSGAQKGHKLWGLMGILSMLTADLRLNVYAPGIGSRRMNLATLMLGEQTTHARAIVRLVREVSERAGVRLLPADTGGNRLHLIRAMLGEQESKKEKKAINGSAIDAALAAIFASKNGGVKSQGVSGPPTSLEEFAQSESDAEMKEGAPLYPRGIVTHNLQGLIHSAYNDMTLLLAQCVAGERVHIQTDRVYRVRDSAISLFAGSYFQGLVTREGQVNADFLSQILPVYCSSHSPVGGWEPGEKALSQFVEYAAQLRDHAVPRNEYKMSEGASKAFNRLRKFQLSTTELALFGYANHRPLTLLKIAGMLCFGRKSGTISESDINLAHMLLLLNESTIEICCIAMHAVGTEARVWLTLVELIDKVGQVRADEAIRYIIDRARVPARDAPLLLEGLIGSQRLDVDESTGHVQLCATGHDTGLAAFTAQMEMKKESIE